MQAKRRNPQLALRLDASMPDPSKRWCAGANLRFMGRDLHLVFPTDYAEATLLDDKLHLPLPPHAVPQQIRDRAEAWLRAQAHHTLTELIRQSASLTNRQPPRLKLSFASGSHWVDIEANNNLRCNWRLIEQAPSLIAHVIARAIATLPALDRPSDLFGYTLSAHAPGTASAQV